LEQKVVPASTVITQPFGTTDASLKPIDGTNALQETWKIGGSTFPTITLRKFDSELQAQVYTEQTIVTEGAGYSPGSLDLDYEDRYIDDAHMLRRVDKVTGLPASFSTWTTSMFTFPGILTSLSFALVTLATATRHEPQWSAGVRASFSATTNIQNITEFFAPGAPPALLSPYTWAQADIVFKGLSYSINLQNVLTDTWTNIGVTYASDSYYGNTVDRFSISATTPSASNYVSTIGITACISCVIEQYKRFWVRKSSYVIIR
jgi:hypothetical protein